jgi:hypothetical protein
VRVVYASLPKRSSEQAILAIMIIPVHLIGHNSYQEPKVAAYRFVRRILKILYSME